MHKTELKECRPFNDLLPKAVKIKIIAQNTKYSTMRVDVFKII